MKVSYNHQSALDEFIDHDKIIKDLIEGKLEWAVTYDRYPSGRKRITEISLIPAKGGPPKAHFLPHEISPTS